MSDKCLNGASILRNGFMHMLSIVHMFYLSSKSLFVYRHRDEDKGNGNGNGGRRKRVTAPWVTTY